MSELQHFEEAISRTNISNEVRTVSPDPQVTAISQITKVVARLRDQAGMVNNDAARLHEDLLRLQLEIETDEKAKLGLAGLLVELTEEYGLGWSDIGRLVRVSVPAIRKWRNGGEISPIRLHGLAQLAAFFKILKAHDVADPAAWLAVPLASNMDRALSKSVIYAEGHVVELLLYEDHHINHEELLALVGAPEHTASTTELIRNDDGSISIVPIGS